MTPEERELLTRSIKLSEENNKMLRGLRRRARISSFLRTIYWLIIIGTVVASYYAIKPYVAPMLKVFNSTKTNVDMVKDTLTKISSSTLMLGGQQ